MMKSISKLALGLGIMANTMAAFASLPTSSKNDIYGLIVKFKQDSSLNEQSISNRKDLMANIAGLEVKQMRRITGNIFTVNFDSQQIQSMSISQGHFAANTPADIVQKLKENPNIEYVDLDIQMHMLAPPLATTL